jgi:hypothetical protein
MNPPASRPRRLFRSLTKKLDPTDPNTLTDQAWLGVLIQDVRAARSLMYFAEGDIRNLQGLEMSALAGFPNVGPGTAAKIAALFVLCNRLNADRPADPTG